MIKSGDMAPRDSAHDPNTYSAVLHRGWENVRLRYELADDTVIVSETRSFGGTTQKRVPLSGLDPGARRIISRQPAYRVCLILLQFCVLLMAGDVALAMLSTPRRDYYTPLWLMAGAAILVCLWIMLHTRRPREWTFFPGAAGGRGLYILQDRAHAGGPAEHKKFVTRIEQKIAAVKPISQTGSQGKS